MWNIIADPKKIKMLQQIVKDRIKMTENFYFSFFILRTVIAITMMHADQSPKREINL